MKKIKISPYICFMLVVFIALHVVYVQGVIPPQVGWWNYYAWRLNSGEVLYKDIFCFLPPYYVYIMSFLYMIFGTCLMGYQLLGLVLRFLEVCVIYKTVNSFASENISFLSVFAGLVLEVSYLMNMPFDCNQLLRFYIIMSAFFCMKAMTQKKDFQGNISLAIAGGFLGIGLFSKQTCIVIIFFACLGIVMFYWQKKGSLWALQKAAFFLLGVAAACLPGILTFVIQGSFHDFIRCMAVSMSVKGAAGGIVERIFRYQLHFLEMLISVLIFIFLCSQQQYREFNLKYKKRKSVIMAVREICIFVLFLLIVYRACQIIETEAGNVISYAAVILGIIAYIAVRLMMLWLKKYMLKRKKTFAAGALTPIIICLIMMVTMIAAYLLDYQWKSIVYARFSLFALKRGLVNVIFEVMLLVLVRQIIQFVMKKKIYGGLKCFILNGFGMCLLGVGMISSVIEELYMLPVASLLFALLLNAVLDYSAVENKKATGNISCKAIACLPVIVLILFSLGITVIQKQVNPYQWHGWACTGLGRNDKNYVYSKVDGLEGFVLDFETEAAYETIIRLIEENTDEDDVVYEFPYIPLFNVLTERRIGTYSPVHYFDVCPDEIAVADAEYLNENPPEMVIWCEFGEDLWNFHEDYFRGGNESGQRAIRDFYWNSVQQNYTKLYEYKSLSVWLRN